MPRRSVKTPAERVGLLACRAGEKLRRQGSTCSQLNIFIRTSPFRQTAQYAQAITMKLPKPSSDTLCLVQAALAGLHTIYRPGYEYAKAGIHLLDLRPESVGQMQFDFDAPKATANAQGAQDRRNKLMKTMDSINSRFGKGALSQKYDSHRNAKGALGPNGARALQCYLLQLKHSLNRQSARFRTGESASDVGSTSAANASATSPTNCDGLNTRVCEALHL